MGILEGLIAGFARLGLVALFRRYGKLGLFDIWHLRYRKTLRVELNEMPFIYRDIKAEVLKDFVDVEIEQISADGTQKTTETYGILAEGVKDLYKAKKVLILGAAGMGKTTFERHVILSLLEKSRHAVYYRGSNERSLPIYVPLKVVRTTSDAPIFSYILESVSSIHTPHHLERLMRRGRIFLFLDGYDEIPHYSESLSNLVPEIKQYLYSSEYSQMRVWISSRPEFFHSYPLTRGDTPSFGNFCAITLKGVGKNREVLIQRVFERYPVAAAQYLDSEYFLHQIENVSDIEVKSLSYNPLFLTIMAYTYATRVIEEKTPNIDWGGYISDIIIECTRLLIRDLDENKARHLPVARRHAIKTRRNLYHEQKLTFLAFYAFSIYRREMGSFTYSDAKQQAKHYFSDMNDADSQLILREFDNESRNIVSDLVNCGIFVLIPFAGDQRLYDFPHRRFREVFAAEFVCTDVDMFILFLSHLNRPSMDELSQVVFDKRKEVDDVGFQIRVLEQIFFLTKQNNNELDFVVASHHFCRHFSKNGAHFQATIKNFLDNVLVTKTFQIQLSKDVLNLFTPDEVFLKRLNDYLAHLLAGENACPNVVGLLELVAHYLDNDFLSKAERQNMSPAIWRQVVPHLCISNPAVILAELERPEIAFEEMEFYATHIAMFAPVCIVHNALPYEVAKVSQIVMQKFAIDKIGHAASPPFNVTAVHLLLNHPNLAQAESNLRHLQKKQLSHCIIVQHFHKDNFLQGLQNLRFRIKHKGKNVTFDYTNHRYALAQRLLELELQDRLGEFSSRKAFVDMVRPEIKIKVESILHHERQLQRERSRDKNWTAFGPPPSSSLSLDDCADQITSIAYESYEEVTISDMLEIIEISKRLRNWQHTKQIFC